jgi:hypothetical protein
MSGSGGRAACGKCRQEGSDGVAPQAEAGIRERLLRHIVNTSGSFTQARAPSRACTTVASGNFVSRTRFRFE